MEEVKTAIYALVCPLSDTVRYVGKSIHPEKRYYQHLWDKSKSHKTNWIKSLAESGLTPKLLILEEVMGSNWVEAEQRWIQHYKALGIKLTNLTEGGEGAPGVEVGEETREKLRQLHRGKPKSPEHVKKVSEAQKGKKLSEEHINNLVKSHIKHTYRIITPTGETEIVDNLSSYAKANSLKHTGLYHSVKTGKTYRGYQVDRLS